MTDRELALITKLQLEASAKQNKSDLKVTDVHLQNDSSVMRVTNPLFSKIEVFEITVKRLCVYEGLGRASN
jgi:hypothetical protein